MRLITLHRVLIFTAIIFFVGYAAWEFLASLDPVGTRARAGLALVGAVSLGVYFWRLRKKG